MSPEVRNCPQKKIFCSDSFGVTWEKGGKIGIVGNQSNINRKSISAGSFELLSTLGILYNMEKL